MSGAMDFMPTFRAREINRVLRVVFNTDLRNSHDGLSILAKDFKIDTAQLRPGEYIVFVNRSKTALKLYAAGQVVAHFRMPTHRKMDMRVISLIPRFFNGRELKYDDALRELITKQWGQRT
jgi:hypothetical protein